MYPELCISLWKTKDDAHLCSISLFFFSTISNSPLHANSCRVLSLFNLFQWLDEQIEVSIMPSKFLVANHWCYTR